MSRSTIMWLAVESLYRGQASDGTVVTVEEDAMVLAHAKAGKVVYEVDWWPETLRQVLERWGIFSKSWVDEDTRQFRMHFKKGEPRRAEDAVRTSGPLTARLSGSLPKEPPEE